MVPYFLDLFSPETWQAFRETDRDVTGFRERHRRLAGERVSPGDVFLYYLTRLSRWCGLLEVQSGVYEDDSPLLDDPDPFTVRFKVKPVVVLDPEAAVLIREQEVWEALSITNQYDKSHPYWTGFFRGSLNRFEDSDGSYLVELLKEQQANPSSYPLTTKDRRELARKRRVRALGREVEVEIPDSEKDEDDTLLKLAAEAPATKLTPPEPAAAAVDGRESIRMQAKVAQVGAEMGYRIWVPRNDKARVLKHVSDGLREKFLEELPLNYDEVTLRTIEQIDVLWLKGRSMARAFEIEHTTAVYSGLLRMADLLALQPNMDISLHIVAPPEKRDKVLREIRRPVFSLLERGPLYEQCSFLSYDSIHALGETPHLAYMSDAIIA